MFSFNTVFNFNLRGFKKKKLVKRTFYINYGYHDSIFVVPTTMNDGFFFKDMNIMGYPILNYHILLPPLWSRKLLSEFFYNY